jgi:hypothetical protein
MICYLSSYASAVDAADGVGPLPRAPIVAKAGRLDRDESWLDAPGQRRTRAAVGVA